MYAKQPGYEPILVMIFFILFCSCKTKISKPEKLRMEADQVSRVNIKLLGENDAVPEKAKLIRKLKIGTSMFCYRNCNTNLSDEAILQAEKDGGNMVQIVNYNPADAPDPFMTLNANIYWVGNTDSAESIKTHGGTKHIVLDQPLNSFGEVFGGMGFGFSLEYERKLTGKYSGLGIRAGIGIPEFDISFTSFPIQVNYLFGNNGYYFELGAGITCVRNNEAYISSNYSFNIIKVPTAMRMSYYGTAFIGYRGPLKLQVSVGAFRVGLTPYFGYHQVSALLVFGIEAPFY